MSMLASIIAQSKRRFNPLSLSPALWLDASDASTLYDSTSGGSLVAADGTIARWEDKSGNARHLTQSTGTFQPLRKTAVKNGRDVVRFDGGNDYMIAASAADWRFLHESDSTAFIVFRAGDVTDPETLYVLAGTSVTVVSPGGSYYAHDTRVSIPRNNALVHVSGHSGPRVIADSQNTIAGNQYGIFTNIHRATNATPADRSEIYANGGSVVKNNAQTTALSTGNPRHALAVGAAQNSSGVFSSFLLGDICEILLFNSALSTTPRENVRNYLNAKWAAY